MSGLTYHECRRLETDWMSDAACRSVPGLPWTEHAGRIPKVLLRMMSETCARCPVKRRCESFINEAEITAGFWAGRSQWGKNVADYHRLQVASSKRRTREAA